MPRYEMPQRRSRQDLMLTAQRVITETYDVMGVDSAGVTATGIVHGSLAGLYAGEIVTNILAVNTVANSAQTLLKFGIYDTAGNQLGVTADVKAAFASTGKLASALTAAYTVPASGAYYLVVLGVGGTQPTLLKFSTNANAYPVVGSGFMRCVQEASQTDLDPTCTFVQAASASNGGFWLAAS